MNTFWELLFLAWCVPFDESRVPDHLQGDPFRAYGEYAFRQGVQLGLTLAVSSLQRWEGE